MAAPAGELIDEALPRPERGAVAKGKGGVAAGDQLLVGDIPALRVRVAPVAGCADAALGIMGRVARQAELPGLCGNGGDGQQQSNRYACQKVSNQSASRKYRPVMVSSAETMTAEIEISRCPGGNQRAWCTRT